MMRLCYSLVLAAVGCALAMNNNESTPGTSMDNKGQRHAVSSGDHSKEPKSGTRQHQSGKGIHLTRYFPKKTKSLPESDDNEDEGYKVFKHTEIHPDTFVTTGIVDLRTDECCACMLLINNFARWFMP
jgi:hypothetical protein